MCNRHSIEGRMVEVAQTEASTQMTFRSPELEFLDLLTPWDFGIGVIGFVLAWFIMAVLERTGLTRFLWHLPLFFLALLVLISSLLGLVLHP